MKQLLKDMYITEKRVILRCDLNVPISNGNILDDTKIIKSLETINYLLQNNCKIIILSHLGRVKTPEDLKNNSLEPVKNHLERLLNKKITFVRDILSPITKEIALNMEPASILMLENTRFLDIPNKLESTLNEEVAATIASLGEIFVFDAFAVAHRNHTTVTGIPKYLPNCLGFLAEKEITMLSSLLTNPPKPFCVLMGGAKVDDKLSIIKNLLPKCDYLLLSGGLANSFLAALNLNVGASLKTNDQSIINELRALMLQYKEKFALPLDVITTSTYDATPKMKATNQINDDDIIKDIGSKTINKYRNIINECNTIFLNGTMGVYEEAAFKNGTIEIFNILKNKPQNVIIGGGDTTSALNNLNFKNVFPNISSGGGATLEWLADPNNTLPGIEAISEVDEIEVLDL